MKPVPVASLVIAVAVVVSGCSGSGSDSGETPPTPHALTHFVSTAMLPSSRKLAVVFERAGVHVDSMTGDVAIELTSKDSRDQGTLTVERVFDANGRGPSDVGLNPDPASGFCPKTVLAQYGLQFEITYSPAYEQDCRPSAHDLTRVVATALASITPAGSAHAATTHVDQNGVTTFG